MSQPVSQSVSESVWAGAEGAAIYVRRGSERSQESRSRERRKRVVSGSHRLPCHLSLFTPPLAEADGGSVEGKVTWLSSPAVSLFISPYTLTHTASISITAAVSLLDQHFEFLYNNIFVF